ncbi:hypothetical protein [Vibrio phage RYC]|nr:hypothetical protein [Vibrio phage RYC]
MGALIIILCLLVLASSLGFAYANFAITMDAAKFYTLSENSPSAFTALCEGFSNHWGIWVTSLVLLFIFRALVEGGK